MLLPEKLPLDMPARMSEAYTSLDEKVKEVSIIREDAAAVNKVEQVSPSKDSTDHRRRDEGGNSTLKEEKIRRLIVEVPLSLGERRI